MLCNCPYCGAKKRHLPKYKLIDGRQCFIFSRGIISLSLSETVILRSLLDAADEGAERESLLMAVYVNCRHQDDPLSDRNFIIMLATLRKKLEKAGAPVTISRGLPYQKRVFLEQKNPQLVVEGNRVHFRRELDAKRR